MNSEENQTTSNDGFIDLDAFLVSDAQRSEVSASETSNMEINEVTSDASIESSPEPSEVVVITETAPTSTPKQQDTAQIALYLATLAAFFLWSCARCAHVSSSVVGQDLSWLRFAGTRPGLSTTVSDSR